MISPFQNWPICQKHRWPPVLFDCRVTKEENCFPMIPSGKAHNEMIMAGDTRDLGTIIDDAGKGLV